MKEHYSKWIPINAIEQEMWVEAIHDDNEGLKIFLRGRESSSQKICIKFETYYIYRNTDESYRILLWAEGTFEEKKWPLCKTSQSNLIDWIYEEADGVYKKEEMIHYLIKTGLDVVEVVTNLTPPQIVALDEKDSEKINTISKMQSVVFRDERNVL